MVPQGRRAAAVAAALAAISAVVLGQGRARLAAATPVHVRAILIDGQLNQKPVPRLELRIASATDAAVATARTDFDGHVDIELPPGRYTLTTPSGVSFEASPIAGACGSRSRQRP
jgi:hypothetical protein